MEAELRTENPSILGRPECRLPIQGLCEVCRERPAENRHHIIGRSFIKAFYPVERAMEMLANMDNLVLICNGCHQDIDRVPKKEKNRKRKKFNWKEVIARAEH